MKLIKSSGNPMSLNGNISVQCQWSTEFLRNEYPFLGQASITFWWNDVRNETWIPACKVSYVPARNIECYNTATDPKFAAENDITTDKQIMKVTNIRYQADVRCSLTVLGDRPYHSETITVKVTGKDSVSIVSYLMVIFDYIYLSM